MSSVGIITIDIDPFIELGPVTLAWHGMAIVVGLFVGALMARRFAAERGLDAEPVIDLVFVVALSGIVGSRLFYLVINDPGALVDPVRWLGTRGFAFYGALILAPIAAAAYMRWKRLDTRYLDALAAGFPLGVFIGRFGDLVNGEHFGPESTALWAVRNVHPDADVPSNLLAYHSGGLYEMALGLAIFALIWPLRHRLTRPLSVLWSVIALYGAGRLLMFFFRTDAAPAALGLNEAQWTSLALIAAAGLGAYLSRRRWSDPVGQSAPA
ncbi:MAG: prolipoprotein diacylglyceryl transferase [Thermoleophilaceae bacterium]|nr:prolipoprotein diacylglyceryl transferase [Thermoleophilaceae bacterium]